MLRTADGGLSRRRRNRPLSNSHNEDRNSSIINNHDATHNDTQPDDRVLLAKALSCDRLPKEI